MIFLKQITLVCLISACFFSCKTDTNTANAEDTKNKYTRFIMDMKAEGLATGNILVYEDGKVVFKSSNGLRSINPIDSLNFKSQFRLASVSKQFTGMAIMKLKEAGEIEYDQNVNTILTDFPYDNISVRHLLHHISGLTDYERIIARNFVKEDTTKTYILGNDEVLKEFYRVNPKLDFQPGEKWEYSNTGYIVLASIVEKISGQHFRDFLKQKIFDPVGMRNTTLYSYQIDADSNMPNRVYGYRYGLNQKDLIINDYNIVNGVRGDDGIYSTLEDLYKWNMALVNHTIIPKDYLDEAWTPGKLNNGDATEYGFGWGLVSKPGEPIVVNHSGGWVGFATFLHNEVDAKNGFIILTNDSGENYRPILDNVRNMSDGKHYVMPRKSVYKEMAKRTYNTNVKDAIEFYHKVKTDTIGYVVSEGDNNWLGYAFLNENKPSDALAIFKLNIEEFPKSANTYDSYGDALLVKGDTLLALENFRKCFAMDSTLLYAKDKSKVLEAALKVK
ncbi:serine hydrolase domain-containing protein [Psychroserpens ponticola]|uniref:Serine hydrolase n=1 Tax=Psychroserpens ponticola TaxID=2932268 RepID=A0ABY7RZE1_9FLAO|nr:serine hydrolase domain-containing protein [Psychroserpens ponticola]WCO02499.1 serine hydrolase [Psychroserpens ponticola]